MRRETGVAGLGGYITDTHFMTCPMRVSAKQYEGRCGSRPLEFGKLELLLSAFPVSQLRRLDVIQIILLLTSVSFFHVLQKETYSRAVNVLPDEARSRYPEWLGIPLESGIAEKGSM